MKLSFRIEVRKQHSPYYVRRKEDRKEWAWHTIALNGKRLGWSGMGYVNRAHAVRMVERLFDAKARGIEVRVDE